MKKAFSLTSLILIASFAGAQTSLPTGTAVKMKLETTLATFSSKAGDPFSARVTAPVVVDGKTVIPIGATVEGRVTKANEPRRIAGKPTIAIFPENLVLPNGDRCMGTGGGMLIGGLAGGGKGFLIGGAIGATATVAHWLGKHRSAMLPAGTELVMELNRPMTMTMTVASGGQ